MKRMVNDRKREKAFLLSPYMFPLPPFPSLPVKKKETIQYSRKSPVTIAFGSHKSDRCFSPVRTQGFQCEQTYN